MKIRVKIDSQVFEVDIADLHARPVRALVDGEPFEVSLEDAETPPQALPAADRPAAQPAPPPQPQGADRSKAVVAPIPGVILSIGVKVGDSVALGQELCMLEAMKMKNILRASRAGTVARVLVAAQEHVHHGQVLMEYSD